MLKLLTILFSVLWLAPKLSAAPEYVTRQSLSRQFVVYGPKASPIRHFQSERVPLDSALAAVSCERIKQALLDEIDGSERRPVNFQSPDEGKIFVVLHPKIYLPVVVTPISTSGSLNYRIDLPNEIEATRLIDAVTETILLEIVNRHSTDHFTQIPRWLTQGLAAQAQSAAPETLVLEQHLPVTKIKKQFDPIAEIRSNPTNFVALTFDELSWPETLSAEKSAHYRQNAQIFVEELLRLKNGSACLRQMLESLPDHPHWQIGFMSGFESHFQKLVDVEKWWGLTVINLTGHGSGKILSREQSIEQIDAVLQVPAEIVHDFGALPKRNNLTLQEIVLNMESRQQKMALEKVISQLRVLRIRIQPDMMPLLDEYRATLENYLQNDEKNLLKRVFSRGNLADLRQTTRAQLDKLDQQRAKFRDLPKKITPTPSTREEAILSALEIVGQRKQ